MTLLPEVEAAVMSAAERRAHQPGRQRRRVPRALGLLATGILVVGAPAVAATGAWRPILGVSDAPVAAVDPAVAAILGLFRRAAASSDVPSAATLQPAAVMLAHFGGNPRLARLAFVTPQGSSVYLIPAQGGACLLNSAGTAGLCATTTQIESGQAMGGDACSPTLPSDQVEIAGIVPDGIENATVVLSNGATEPLATQRNAYVLRTARGRPLPKEIRWSAPSGPESAAVALPPDAGSISCVSGPQALALAKANSHTIP